MLTMRQAAAGFLANKRIAVKGDSRKAKDHAANTVFMRVIYRGHVPKAV